MFTSVVVPLLAGLSIFLFGMKVMELALHKWTGAYLRHTLERFTRTPARGMLTSTGLTAILQSSSAVTVITIGLVNAGVMTFPQTLGIILGTNIGTCLTTELIGLNLNKAALPLLLATAGLWLASLLLPEGTQHSRRMTWRRPLRCALIAAAGFSCVLLGMEVMQGIMPALQSRGLFAWFVQQSQQSLLWGIIVGALLTAAIHSSAVTIAMAMGLAAVQAISVELGIAIVIGANIGTCVTAWIASIGGSRYGVYVAWTHILLNAGGALLFFPFIGLLDQLTLSLASTPSGQIAHAQTIFNIVSSLMALPFCYLPALKRLR